MDKQECNMIQNNPLDKLKKDLREIAESIKDLYDEIIDIVDGEGFNDESTHRTRVELKNITRDILRARKYADTIETYIINDVTFTNMLIRLNKVYSGLKVLELACEANEKEVYKEYLDDFIGILSNLSKQIQFESNSIESDIIGEEEYQTIAQNKLFLIKK